MLHNKLRVQRRAVLSSRGEWPWSMNRIDKQMVAWEWLNDTPNSVHVLPCKDGNSVRTVPPLTNIETA